MKHRIQKIAKAVSGNQSDYFCIAAVKLQGDSCTVVNGSSASNWPKFTFTVLIHLHGSCKGVWGIVANLIGKLTRAV